ncbi:hypothetical protein K502DRAFT_349771 [Neoconidiobolus thromboides FSU 785]|nr:hypothetical protein K502DRAFT_349771 [Neoconidiobolus thromboides FSU 785]
MDSSEYMKHLVIQPVDKEDLNRIISGYIIISIEILAFLFNALTFYLIKKQGFKTLDMWIASCLAFGDILFVAYKLAQLVVFRVLGVDSVYLNIEYGQVDGCFEVFMMLFSANCVGALALLRFWALYLKRPIVNGYWITIFVLQNMICLTLLLIAAVKKEFILMPLQRYYFLNTVSNVLSTRIGAWFIIITNIFNFIIVNVCYPLLYYNFSNRMETIDQEREIIFDSIKTRYNKKKRSILIKTSITLLLYNTCLLPILIISIREQLNGFIKSYNQDVIVSSTVMLLCFVNPLILLILHDDINRSLKDILKAVVRFIKGAFKRCR